MCPVQTVTHVSGRSTMIQLALHTKLPESRAKWPFLDPNWTLLVR